MAKDKGPHETKPHDRPPAAPEHGDRPDARPPVDGPKPGPTGSGPRPEDDPAFLHAGDEKTEGGTGEGNPDIPTQPKRPDATTQQPRPGVGGGRPEEAFPDRPDVTGLADDPAQDAERRTLEEVRERSEGTGVFRVTSSILGGFEPPQLRAGNEFPPGTDFKRLVKLGALEVVEELRRDPHRERAMAAHPQMADEVEGLHDDLMRAQKEIETLRAANAALKEENDKLKKK